MRQRWQATRTDRTGGWSDAVVREVLTVVLPDDDACEDDHPWSWLAELARARGLDATERDLRGLPYEVVLGEEVLRWLAGD